ncbi:MAG: helix-turn-helix transcriptional regulator [Clostridiales bacterium]|nr:helix-turn-helix transcriptional regulator [Clostridiales bacterium]
MNIDLLKQMAKEMELPEYYFCNEYHIFIENTDVSTFLQEMRLGLGLNQRKFAEKVDIPLDAYKTYEQGKIRIPMRYWKKIMDWKEKLNLESGSEAKMN